MEKYFDEYIRWKNFPGMEDNLLKELADIEGNDAEITERFYTELDFGTAGLRGILGAGTNRMNIYVVRRATAGLAKYLCNTNNTDAANRGVAIAYDSRRYSGEFAREAACTLARYGIKCFLFDTLHSVPQLSFTVRELHCIAGIVITASHNPPEYNGYKVYWEHGGQVTPDQAAEILSCIRSVDYFEVSPMPYEEAAASKYIRLIGDEIDEIYYRKTMTLRLNPEIVNQHGGSVNIVYTPLHGSGYVPVTTVLKRMGISNLHVVEQQRLPDGNFPTVKAPNPEDPNAFTLAFELADKVKANLVLATDPDSDRLGVAVRNADGIFQVLTGNQIGCLLINYIISMKAEQHCLEDDGFIVKSIVSTKLADAICRKHNVEIRNVLTGFRFVAEQIDLSESSGKGKFLFGFEESYGFLAGGFAHDKDAICAAMLVAEAAVYYSAKAGGKTLIDVLDEIYRTYGFYLEKTKSYTLTGKQGIEKIANAMEQLKADPPSEFGDEKVVTYDNFNTGMRLELATDISSPIGLPKSNVLMYCFASDSWIVVRPSGTEPKLKLYVGSSGCSRHEAEQKLERLLTAADKIISPLLN